jgi:predicted DNA-binding ribbon-helix-helix protein
MHNIRDNMGSLSRYIKEHYKRIYLRKDFYEKLKELADKEGISIPDLIVKMYDHYIMPNIRDNIMPNTAVSEKVSLNIRDNIIPNIRHNITGSDASKTRVFCKSKSEIRDVSRYVKKLKDEGVLIDWWDEGSKYCFEVKE